MGKILESEGASTLVETALRTLDNPDFDMAVIRNIHLGNEEARVDFRQQILRVGEASARPQFYSQIPEAEELDDAMADWWAGQPSHGFRIRPQLAHSSKRRSGIIPHFDLLSIDSIPHNLEGPLTMSWRIDGNPELKRTFYAKRIGGLATLSEGNFAKSALITMHELKQAALVDGIEGASVVDQGPDDMVLFANHPAATLHNTEASNGTLALVLSYGLQSSVERSRTLSTEINELINK